MDLKQFLVNLIVTVIDHNDLFRNNTHDHIDLQANLKQLLVIS